MKHKILVLITSILLIGVIAILGFYYSLGIGFGKAVVKAGEGVQVFAKELEAQEMDLIDTIEKETIKFMDTIPTTSEK